MKKIKITREYLNKLKRLNARIHAEANLYYKNNTLYKIFYKNTPKIDLKRKEKKIEIISTLEYREMVCPIEKLVSYDREKKYFMGYTMEYIKNSMTLYEKISSLNPKMYLKLISEISKFIKRVHTNNDEIVFCDLSFHNILIDDELKYYLIDLDNIKINGYDEEKISSLAYYYLEFRNIHIKLDANFDRLTFLLYYLDSIFNADIWDIGMKQYDMMSEKIGALKELRSLVVELKKQNRRIPYIPYLSEVINEDDMKCKKYLR